MRILFAVNPEKTIFLSMVSMARALGTAGHEVCVASQPRFAERITEAGLTAVPVGRNNDPWRVTELTPELMEMARAGLPPPWDVVADPAKATWDDLLYDFDDAVTDTHKPQNFPIIADLVTFARAWRPDLVVWEPLTYAGAIAAKACGAAHARLPWGLDIFGVAREIFLKLKDQQPAHRQSDPLADWLGSYARKYGGEYSEDMATGHFTIDQLAPPLSMRADLHYVPVRYVPYGGHAAVHRWLWAPPERPRVTLTLGMTAIDRLAGYATDAQQVLDALADLDIEVIATIAESEQEKLGAIPPNARVVAFAPLHALVPTCSAVIHHGGFGTMNTVALYGVPQLALPYHFEGPLLSWRLEAQGAGLAVHAEEATGTVVRQKLLRLLSEPRFQDRATAMSDEIRAMPSPNDIVRHLEDLTDAYRTVDR